MNKPSAKQETAQPTAERLKKKNKPSAKQETAQPTAARFNKQRVKHEPPSAHGRADNKHYRLRDSKLAEWRSASGDRQNAEKEKETTGKT